MVFSTERSGRRSGSSSIDRNRRSESSSRVMKVAHASLVLIGSDPGAARCLVRGAGHRAGTGAPPTRFEFAETHMGSEFKVVLYTADESIARSASRAAFARIAALDAILSDYQPDSELMRLCAGPAGPRSPVSADLFDVLERSRSMYER